MIHELPQETAGATHVEIRDIRATPGHDGAISVYATPGTVDASGAFVPSPHFHTLPGIIPPARRSDFDAFAVERGRPEHVQTRLELLDVIAWLDAEGWGSKV